MPRIKQRKPVIVQLVRHSFKSAKAKGGLSRKGMNEAVRSGARVPNGYKLAARHSDFPRAKTTAKGNLTGYRYYSRGETYRNVRERAYLSYMPFTVNEERFDELVEKQGEIPIIRRWLDGKISREIAIPATEYADQIIRRALRVGSVLNRKGARSIAVRNISHAWVVEAVFERLSGKHFEQTTPRNQIVRENEGLQLTFYPKGKIVLKYRNKNYNVTKRFNEIISTGYS